MSASTWYIISLVGYFSAFIGLVISIVLYFRLNILDVIGDLTGRTVARELKSMRENRNSKGSTAKAKMAVKSGSRKTKSGKQPAKKTAGKTAVRTAGRTGDMSVSYASGVTGKRAKNGTAEMGVAFHNVQPDKLVLHSKTDKLDKDVETLYEDFDPRVEYSRTDILEEPSEPKKATAILRGGTDILEEDSAQIRSERRTDVLAKPGTEVLIEPEISARKGTEVLTQRGTEVLTKPGTEVLQKRGTEVLKSGTTLLEETHAGGTTLLMEEEQVEPVKFSVTRSYLIVHSEETILEEQNLGPK